MNRIPALDGLRGIAIILVLIWHYFCCQIDSRNAFLYAGYKLFEWSWSGVDLFFVLSGFLIGGILLDQRGSKNLLQVFYWRRALRILPLYCVMVVLFFVILNSGPYPANPFRMPELFDNFIGYWPYIVFLQNFAMARADSFGPIWLAVTWSLAIEEQFYLLLPLIVLCCPFKVLPRMLVGLVALIPVLRVLVGISQHNTFPCYVLLVSRADPLLLGVLVAYIVRQPQWATVKSQTELWIAFVMLAIVIGMLSYYDGNPMSLGMVVMGYYAIALLFTCLLALVLRSGGTILEKILINKALTGAGRISYGIYLIHMPVLGLIYGFVLHRPPYIDSPISAAVTALALLTTIVVAILSWHFFESPLVNLAHKLKYKPSGNT